MPIDLKLVFGVSFMTTLLDDRLTDFLNVLIPLYST